jgi:Putative ATPase subunit of terminase (gpP-like)
MLLSGATDFQLQTTNDRRSNNMQSQNKLPVDREAVRILAIELGAREAARRLGLNPNTVLSWAKRDNWELPNRKGGATKASANAITLQSKPGDVLIATHKELETKTKTALMQAVAKAAQLAAQKPAMDVSTTAQLRDLALTMAKLCGWDGNAQPSVNYYGDVNTVVVCDENRRKQLIEQRQRLLEAESSGKVIEVQ